MKLIIDENISSAKEAFSGFGDVVLMQGREITNESLKDAEFLIVRSVTKVNEKLLNDTPVKFVGTATIGTDHIDLDYLKSREIAFSDAKGCNADAVAEYVFTSVLYNAVKYNFSLKGKTIGVVGVGNIGSRVVRLANAAGMKVIKNDPPVKRKTSENSYRDLEEIFDADIITLHVPLNKEGIDKTVHLMDRENLLKLKEGTLLINASRGEVIDNGALNSVPEKQNLIVNLDVWENEPEININLLNKVELATPHIAGYSLEGKVNGTLMIYNALCGATGTASSWKPLLPDPEKRIITLRENNGLEHTLHKIFSLIYDITEDDKSLKALNKIPEGERGKYFDQLRKNYRLRREFKNFTIKNESKSDEHESILRAFGFNISH